MLSKQPNIPVLQQEIDNTLKKIKYIHKHCTANKKDASSKIMLMKKIGRLKKMKKYLSRVSVNNE